MICLDDFCEVNVKLDATTTARADQLFEYCYALRYQGHQGAKISPIVRHLPFSLYILFNTEGTKNRRRSM